MRMFVFLALTIARILCNDAFVSSTGSITSTNVLTSFLHASAWNWAARLIAHCSSCFIASSFSVLICSLIFHHPYYHLNLINTFFLLPRQFSTDSSAALSFWHNSDSLPSTFPLYPRTLSNRFFSVPSPHLFLSLLVPPSYLLPPSPNPTFSKLLLSHPRVSPRALPPVTPTYFPHIFLVPHLLQVFLLRRFSALLRIRSQRRHFPIMLPFKLLHLRITLLFFSSNTRPHSPAKDRNCFLFHGLFLSLECFVVSLRLFFNSLACSILCSSRSLVDIIPRWNRKS